MKLQVHRAVIVTNLEADQATEAVSPTLLALHQCHQMARLRIERRSPQMSQPPSIESILLQVQLLLAGHVTRIEDARSILKPASRRKARSWCSKKALQRSAEGDSLHGRESAISHGSRSPQTETADANQ